MSRTEYMRRWRADNQDKVTAAKLRYRDKQALKKINCGRLITVRQEKIYRLTSPDFYNLPYWAAAKLIGVCTATICNELKRIKKACPMLFPLYPPACPGMKMGIDRPSTRYSKWMDDMIIMKF